MIKLKSNILVHYEYNKPSSVWYTTINHNVGRTPDDISIFAKSNGSAFPPGQSWLEYLSLVGNGSPWYGWHAYAPTNDNQSSFYFYPWVHEPTGNHDIKIVLRWD